MNDKKLNIINTGILNLLGIIFLYIIAVIFLKNISLNIFNLNGLIIIILAAILPTILWITFYYFIDRKEPEPLYMIIMAFISGIICKLIFFDFIGNILFDLQSWNLNNDNIPLIYALFKNGFIPAFGIFFIIRFFFYPSKFFNEPVDGMIYGAVIGIGYAFMITMDNVFSAMNVSLYYLILILIIKIPLFSSCSALIGYKLGNARFNPDKKNFYFILSIIIFILIFSLYALLDYFFKINISTSSDIYQIALTFVFSLIIFIIVYVLIELLIQKNESKSMDDLPFTIDKISIIILIVFILSGLIFRLYVERDYKFINENKKISFNLQAKFKYTGLSNEILIFSKNVFKSKSPVQIKINLVKVDNIYQSYNKLNILNGYYYEKNESCDFVEINDNMKFNFFSNTNKELYKANIINYIFYKDNKKIIISVFFPLDYTEDHFTIVKKIIKTLNWED